MPIETRIQAAGTDVLEAAGRLAAEAVAVPVRPGRQAPEPAVAGPLKGTLEGALGEALPCTLDELLALHRAKGEPGELTSTTARIGDRPCELLLYGVGDASPAALRRAGAALARRGKGRETLVAAVPDGDLAAFAEGALLGSYGFRIGAAPPRPALRTLALAGPDTAAIDAAAGRGGRIARAAALARDLANTPAREKDPSWLAARAGEIAAESGLTVRVRDEKDLVEGGFGGLLAVGAGSSRPPRLIEMSYEPEGGGSGRHVVLVGKGITFDTGGLSLKPNEGMKTMKTDMAGGAVIMAVLGALRDLGVRDRVTGLVAAAENMPSGSAMRPGDVITHFGGTTSEVLNTDAEGRLVLADALAYADAELDPDVVVDVATLTGAAKVALGLRHGALFANDDALAGALTGAGTAAGEPVWRLPMVEEYRQGIESEVADVANIERRGFGGGSIMAALFLREFVGDRTWAHLDVAGPGRSTADDGDLSKGATGFGTRLLLSWLTA
ncbi:M17 family metallopeptidase [Actinomadura sp. 21ATH]|uniref:leucyl aminopeptidase family protein n=1 Tax=Actinomadura sp. 21ATH TaxID=1735444 RepID=UPI0035C19487